MNCGDCKNFGQGGESAWSDFSNQDSGCWCEVRDVTDFTDKGFPYQDIPQYCIDNKLFKKKCIFCDGFGYLDNVTEDITSNYTMPDRPKCSACDGTGVEDDDI